MTTANDLYFVQQLVGDMANFAYLIGSRSARQSYVVDPAWNVQGLLDRAVVPEILDPLRFCRGVPVKSARLLEPVMVRRLKGDLRGVVPDVR